MRYMLMIKATRFTEAGIEPNPDFTREFQMYMEELAKAGMLMTAESLQPSSTGVKIIYTLDVNEPELRMGPFTVGEDLLAGFMVIDAMSQEDALDWAKRMPVPSGCGEYQIELRQLAEETEWVRDAQTMAMQADLLDQIGMMKNF